MGTINSKQPSILVAILLHLTSSIEMSSIEVNMGFLKLMVNPSKLTAVCLFDSG
jgi:hypothetical protein